MEKTKKLDSTLMTKDPEPEKKEDLYKDYEIPRTTIEMLEQTLQLV